MVSTISFIETKMQHSTTASRILTRTVSVKGIDRALIQEPWYREDRILGLNTPGYTLYSAGGTDRPRACIIARNMTIWMLPGFSCRDLVAVLVKYIEDEAERRLVVPLICHDSEDHPPPRKFEEFLRYCENKIVYLVMGCDSNAHHTAWGSTNCNVRGKTLLGFLNSSNVEIVNQGNEPTFCSGSRLEVLWASRKHYNLGCFFRALPVGSQTYSVHSTGLRTGRPDQET